MDHTNKEDTSVGHLLTTNSGPSTLPASTENVSEESQKKLNLFQSILMNDTDSLNELLDVRTNKFILRLRNRDALSRTPLYYAAQLGKTEIVERLLKTGACNIEDADTDGWTCLFVACLYGNKDIVELLLRYDAKTEAVEERYGWTPLFAATCKNHVEIVKMLLAEGATVHVKDKTGRTPLWIAVMLEHEEIIQELINNGAEINSADDKGRTPAYIAVQMEKKNALKILLDNNADLNIADQDGRTPLILAFKLHLTEIQEFLISRGADQSGLDKEKQDEEENKYGPCRGVLVKHYKTNPGVKIHCFTATSNNVWGGATDGSILVWDLYGELVVHADKVFPNSIVDMVSVEDEVWVLSPPKDINILKLNVKYAGTGRKKSEGNDKKLIDSKPLQSEEFEIGCLAKYDDKYMYGGSTFKDNTITLYCWSTKPPYTRKKDVLQINDNNPEIPKLCNQDPLPIKIQYSRDHLFIAVNKFVFIFSSKGNHQFQHVLDDHKSRITAMVEAQGRLWTASKDSSIRLWEISDTKKVCLSTLENAHDEENVSSLAVVGNQQVISGGGDKLRSRSTKSNSLIREREREFQTIHDHGIDCLLWIPKTKYLWVSSLDKSISIWS